MNIDRRIENLSNIKKLLVSVDILITKVRQDITREADDITSSVAALVDVPVVESPPKLDVPVVESPPKWIPGDRYNFGVKVIHGDSVYTCINTHWADHSWDASCWRYLLKDQPIVNTRKPGGFGNESLLGPGPVAANDPSVESCMSYCPEETVRVVSPQDTDSPYIQPGKCTVPSKFLKNSSYSPGMTRPLHQRL